MDETRHWHILIFQPCRILLGFVGYSDEAVSCVLVADFDAAVSLDGIFWSCCCSNLSIIRSAGVSLRNFNIVLIYFFTNIFCFLHGFLLGLACIFLFLGCECKLTGLDLLRCHGHLAVEAYIITLGEEDVLIVVAVPVLLKHRGNLGRGKVLVE